MGARLGRRRTPKTRSTISCNQSPTPCTPITSTSAEVASARYDGAIQMSLMALFEGASLAAKLPYISSLVGPLLQVINIREEVKQYKEECKILLLKLVRVASIVANIGALCERHNMNEEDLPVFFRAMLYSHLRDLNGILCVVTRCTKMKGMKRLLLRNDILKQLKQYDGELSNVLQAFQVELLLDIRFALMKREVSSPQSPAEPKQYLN